MNRERITAARDHIAALSGLLDEAHATPESPPSFPGPGAAIPHAAVAIPHAAVAIPHAAVAIPHAPVARA